jgi:hypothetical protein
MITTRGVHCSGRREKQIRKGKEKGIKKERERERERE